MSGQDFSNASMLELFRMEVESHSAVLNDGLVKLADGPAAPELLEALMRAAHSIKGAARIVALQQAVGVAHAMEDCFVAAQKGELALNADHVEVLLRGTDFLTRSGKEGNPPAEQEALAEQIVTALRAIRKGAPAPAIAPAPAAPARVLKPESPAPAAAAKEKAGTAKVDRADKESAERAVRVNASSLSRLMGLAGESLVEAGWLSRFEKSLRRLQDQHLEFTTAIDRLSISNGAGNGTAASAIRELQQKGIECQSVLAERLHDLEAFALRTDNLSNRLYREVIVSRMRPFGDGIHAFPRMVHDLARSLGKKVRFDISGRNTDVDRDILEKLEAPLNHLLRNAVDHGIETPQERLAAGKSEQARITLDAAHRGGMLFVTVADDGRGVDIERVRKKIIDRKLTTKEMAEKLGDAEVIEFLFLPGFSTAEKVTEISGRGVGLDVVRTMVQEVSGQVRVTSTLGKGTTFHVQMPITLSVLSALLVDIGAEPYAFPLGRIDKVLKVRRDQILSLENHQYVNIDGQRIGLVPALQVLELDGAENADVELSIVVIGERGEFYGLVVDSVVGEREIVVRPLDPRLGKVSNIGAAALTEDGRPLLIVDVEDLLHSIRGLLSGGRLQKVMPETTVTRAKAKRILVVDDSLTVREVERKLLENKGYKVELATDGVEGWNAVRSRRFDLVITDVDMPRMNGIELVTQMRADGRYKNMPVMIVSYKDREEDRLRGMEAGANYYLTKSSFHDESLLGAVVDLIGEAQ